MDSELFDETSQLKEDSIYSFANELSINIKDMLEEDDRFYNIDQSDVINISLAIFSICIQQFDNPKMRKHLIEVLKSEKEFNELILLLTIDGFNRNDILNCEKKKGEFTNGESE